MADEKKTRLSIVIRAVDGATAKIKAINDRLDKVTKPFRDFKEQLGNLREKSGLDDVIGGFKGVGSAVADVLSKVAMIGAAAGAAVAGLLSLIDGFDGLGDKAEEIGVSVDFLAQMRYAAERSGAAVEKLDTGLGNFSKSLGQARANTGRMASFLSKVSPPLLKQLKGAKSNEAAFDLLADAMAKLEDPAKRAALAQATLGDASLAPMFAKGSKGIKELRDRYLELAGSQEGAAGEAGKVDDALKDLKAATDGVKAALVEGLAPALKVLVDRLRTFFQENRARIAEWAKDLGKKLPGAVMKLVDIFGGVVDAVKPFVDEGWKLKVLAVALAGVIAGPLVASVYSLGVALATTPVGWIVAGIAAIAAGAYLLIKHWDAVSGFFVDLWDTITGKFGWARTLIKTLLWPIIGMPGVVIASWGDITDFFASLWDGVTSVFQKAWEFIKGIVDKVVGAVETVIDAVGAVGKSISIDDARAQLQAQAGRSVSAQAGSALAASSSTEARVVVDFANAPRGTRVATDPQSTADVNLSVGYNMLGAP